MPPFEIVGRPDQSSHEMVKTLLESKYRNDSLAQAKAEMQANERQAQLDRLHAEHIEGIKSKNAESLSKTQQKLELQMVRENELFDRMKNLNSPAQINAHAERMLVEGIDKDRVESLRSSKLTQASELLENIANKQASDNQFERQMGRAMQDRRVAGTGFDAEHFQPETAYANFAKNTIAAERNSLMERELGIREDEVASRRDEIRKQMYSNIGTTAANLGSSLRNQLVDLIGNPNLDADTIKRQSLLIYDTFLEDRELLQSVAAQAGADFKLPKYSTMIKESLELLKNPPPGVDKPPPEKIKVLSSFSKQIDKEYNLMVRPYMKDPFNIDYAKLLKALMPKQDSKSLVPGIGDLE